MENKLINKNDIYLTGVKIIDKQHIKVVRCVNTLNDALESFKIKEEIIKLIDCLDFYTTEHFETEESFMIKFKYDKYDEHKKAHEYFRTVYCQIKNNFIYKKNENVYVLALHLTATMAKWLRYHLENEDKMLAEFLKGKV